MTMGAGDVTMLGPEVLAELDRRAQPDQDAQPARGAQPAARPAGGPGAR